MSVNSLQYFKKQGIFTNLDKYKETVLKLSSDVKILTKIIQGFTIHDGFAKNYGLRHKAGLLHYVGDIIDESLKLDSHPITDQRPPEKRIQICCRDYAVLLTALLREQNISARARCGFAKFDYHEKTWFDHWICEYFDDKKNKWIKVDAQLSPDLQKILNIKYNPFNVPDDLFMASGDAWSLWREKKMDQNLFTIHELSGSWIIRGNLLRDFAAINKVEIEPYKMRLNLNLTWDSWRLMAARDKDLTDQDWKLLDKIAQLSRDVDSHLDEIISLYKQNNDLQPPVNLYERVKY